MPTILLLNKPENVSRSALEKIQSIAPHYNIWIEAQPEKADPDQMKDVEISVGGRPTSMKCMHSMNWIPYYLKRI